MSKMGSHCSFGHLKHKLWPKEGPGVRTPGSPPVLTPDHSKSGIDPKYLGAENVRHTVGKVSTRTTTFLQTATRLEVCSESYEASKSQESKVARFQDSQDKKSIWMPPPWRAEYTIGSEVVAHSQAWGVVCQVSPSSPVAVPTPKGPRMSSNHFVWFHAGPCEWVKLVNSS